MTPDGGLRMRDVVERTGVGEATLRAWETRYGFPAPRRLEHELFLPANGTAPAFCP